MKIATLCLSFALTAAATTATAATTTAGGPTSILIAYRSEPANRPAFRTYLQRDMLARLAKLKHDGVVSSYQILFNPFTTPATWDAMTVLRFTDFAATQRWKEIERTQPGGLNAAGLRLAKPVDTYSADLSWEGQADDPGSEADSVFYVIPYEYSSAD